MKSFPRFAPCTAILVLAVTLGSIGCKQSPAPPVDDNGLAAALQSRLAADGALSSEPIQVSVQNAVATLSGSVSNDAARSLAANDAAQVTGIRTVVNNLTVAPARAARHAAPAVRATPAKTPRAAVPPRHPQIVQQPELRAPVMRQQPPPPQEAAVQPAQSPAPPTPPTPPSPPPAPVVHTLTIPAGTDIPVRINQTLDSATTQPGDTFSGVVSADIVLDGLVAIPQGSAVAGRVDAVHDAGHYSGNSLLSISLTSITHHGEHIPVATASYNKEGAGRGKNTAEKVGGGAAVGAILGGILGGGKGAAIGAAAGGGTGAAVNGVTRGQQVQIPSESLVRFQLSNSLLIHVSSQDATAGSPDGLQHR